MKEYPPDWSAIALAIKVAAHWQCQLCGKQCLKPTDPSPLLTRSQRAKYTVSVHHIDRNPLNSEPSNLVALCASCHLGAHRGERYGRRVHPNQLKLQLENTHE